MKVSKHKAAAVAGSTLLLTSMGAVGVMSIAAEFAQADDSVESEQQVNGGLEAVEVANVVGTFNFTQGEVASNDVLSRHVASASKYLCGSEGAKASEAVSPGEWSISVGGAVEQSFSATLEEMSKEGSAQLVMGCSCAGNPVDGRASANAEVLGVKLSYIMAEAQVHEDANTVVFTSADGYEVALPLFYVKQHFSLIAFDINGEPVANSMGGSNQLWLGSTAASYFVRDVTSITFEVRQTPPPTPGRDAATHTPNIGIVEGGEVA